MKIFKSKSLSKKLILAMLVVIFLGLIKPNVSNAEATEAAQGGKLSQPVVDLVLTIGDGLMDIVQNAIAGQDGHITLDITGNKGWLIKAAAILLGIAATVVAIIVTAGIAGAVAAIVGATATITTGTVVAACVIGGITYFFAVSVLSGAFLPNITVLPKYSVSPQEIFEGKLLIFDTNFFHPKQLMVKYTEGEDGNEQSIKADELASKNISEDKIKYYYYLDSNGKEVPTSKQNTSFELSSVISKWYYAIRNIALVAMMLILVYIGIRMMTSSIASEKSKYKKMLGDWVVSVCLLFVLHYIMVFLVSINEDIIDIIEASTEKKESATVIVLDDEMENKDEFIKAVKNTDKSLMECFTDKDGNPVYDKNGEKESGAGDEYKFTWMTNLVGNIRMQSQLQNGSSEYVGYAMAFLILVFYTMFFAFTYLKRVLYLAFLTVIAPFVAMTYSIDKISDGKAQAFNMWLKEYIFNLLIQPMHLILYMLLISMAYDLAATNIIYTLVAIGFMMPAEKFIRKMFGFEKASTPGLLGGATGAALTMTGMKKLAQMAGHAPGPKGGKPVGKLDKSTSDDDPKGIYSRTADSGGGMSGLTKDIGKDSNSLLNDSDSSVSSGNGEPSLISGGPSASDANINMKDSESPVTKMEREALEEQLADGQITPEELTDGQRIMLGMNNNNQEAPIPEQLEKSDGSKRNEYADKENKAKYQRKRETFKRLAAKGAREALSKENIARGVGTAVKLGTKATGAATGAIIGASAGIASGDISKVGQYAAIGAATGNSVGTAVGNGAVGVVSNTKDGVKNAVTEFNKERYGEDYAQKQKKKQDDEFVKDKEARKFYAQQCSSELVGLKGKDRKERLDQIMNEAVEYRKEGVTDNKIIVKARKLNKEDPTAKSSRLAAVMATKSKDNLDKMKYYQDKVTKQIGGTTAQEINKNAEKLAGL